MPPAQHWSPAFSADIEGEVQLEHIQFTRSVCVGVWRQLPLAVGLAQRKILFYALRTDETGCMFAVYEGVRLTGMSLTCTNPSLQIGEGFFFAPSGLKCARWHGSWFAYPARTSGAALERPLRAMPQRQAWGQLRFGTGTVECSSQSRARPSASVQRLRR